MWGDRKTKKKRNWRKKERRTEERGERRGGKTCDGMMEEGRGVQEEMGKGKDEDSRSTGKER